MATQVIEIDNYFPVKTELLPLGIEMPCDIFIQEGGELKVILKQGERFSFFFLKINLERRKSPICILTKVMKKNFPRFSLRI